MKFKKQDDQETLRLSLVEEEGMITLQAETSIGEVYDLMTFTDGEFFRWRSLDNFKEELEGLIKIDDKGRIQEKDFAKQLEK